MIEERKISMSLLFASFLSSFMAMGLSIISKKGHVVEQKKNEKGLLRLSMKVLHFLLAMYNRPSQGNVFNGLF